MNRELLELVESQFQLVAVVRLYVTVHNLHELSEKTHLSGIHFFAQIVLLPIKEKKALYPNKIVMKRKSVSEIHMA